MRGATAIRTVAGGCDSGRVVVEDTNASMIPVDGSWLPDPTDPATRGCLLELVREALDEPTAHVCPALYDSPQTRSIVWVIERQRIDEDEPEWLRDSGAWGEQDNGHRDPPITGPTEWDALCAALAAAPEGA